MAQGGADPLNFIDGAGGGANNTYVDYGPADLFRYQQPPLGGQEWYKALYRDKVLRPLDLIFRVGFFCLIAVCIVNAGYAAYGYQFTHSYFLDLPVGSFLRDARFSFQWWVLAVTYVRTILIWTACFSQAVPGSIFRHLVHVIGGCLVLALDFSLLVLLGGSWVFCNTNGNPENLCNDPLYCCVYYTNPANQCPNTLPCAPPLTALDLGANPDFVLIFWVNVAGTVADFCVVIPVILLWNAYAYLSSYSSEQFYNMGVSGLAAEMVGAAVEGMGKLYKHALAVPNHPRRRRRRVDTKVSDSIQGDPALQRRRRASARSPVPEARYRRKLEGGHERAEVVIPGMNSV